MEDTKIFENVVRNEELESLIESIPFNFELEPYSYEEIRIAMHYKAMYGLPTTELVRFCKNFLNWGKSIEIGAGNGIFGKALGVICTDNFLQYKWEVEMLYKMSGQPTVPYGKHVRKIDGEKAIEKYAPDVVFSSWITPKFDKDNNFLNMYGVIEERLLKQVSYYIQLCGEVHYNKPIMQLPHIEIRADWIRGRSKNDNYLGIWVRDYYKLNQILENIDLEFDVRICNAHLAPSW